MKTVSVIVCAYNAEETLKRALDSAFSQNFDDYEVILVDDGSTDKTAEIAYSYMERFADKMRIIRQSNKGLSSASNEGIMHATGKFIIRLDADDTFEKDTIKEMAHELATGDFGFVYCNYKVIDGGKSKIIEMNGNVFRMIATNVMFKKKVFEDVGMYKEGTYFEEYDLIARVLKKFKGKIVKKALYNYYRHDSNMTNKKNEWENGVEHLKKDHPELFKNNNPKDAPQYPLSFDTL